VGEAADEWCGVEVLYDGDAELAHGDPGNGVTTAESIP